MKRLVVVFSIITLVLLPTVPISASASPSKLWAVVATGYLAFKEVTDCANSVLEKYPFDEINYLGVAYKTEVREAITSWLKTRSDSNDLIFIYISSHGGGYNSKDHVLDGPLPDLIDGKKHLEPEKDEVDEGLEIRETDPMKDLDGDGKIEDDVWVGIDECIAFNPSGDPEPHYYWDDEVRADLAKLDGHYWRLVFFFDGCREKNGTESCYSGGFIRDLSAPRRIIISTSDETEGGYEHFGELFFDALNPDLDGDADTYSYVLNGVAYKDGKVSMWEAFQYAWTNDPKRMSGDTHPQLDDNGDGVADDKDCSLSVGTYFGFNPIKRTDVNHDGIVDGLDMAYVGIGWQSRIGDLRFNALIDFDDNGIITIRDAALIGRDYGKTFEIDEVGGKTQGLKTSAGKGVKSYTEEQDDDYEEPETRLEIGNYCFNPALSVGSSFYASVFLRDVTDMKGIQIMLRYNASLISATGVYPTDITKDATTWIPVDEKLKFHWDEPPTINNTIGRVWVGAWGFTSFTGDGAVLTIEFQVAISPENGSVSCLLELIDCEILDSMADPISFTKLDGIYSNGP